MATKIVIANPGGGRGEIETDLPVDGVVDLVNRALKTSEKFIVVTQVDGKKRGFEASSVISIRETD